MDHRLFFPATKKNRKFIGDVLSKIIDKSGYILEIGSGSGEHGIIFQKRFPEIIFQTSDPIALHRKSIRSWINYEELNTKMPKPLDINVEIKPWKIPEDLKLLLQGIITINMIHVASWNCTKSLFQESGRLLNNRQFLMLYGPFKIANEHTSKSNALFDKSLKIQNIDWGVRDLDQVNLEGKKNGFILEELINMPANNFSVIYRKAY